MIDRPNFITTLVYHHKVGWKVFRAVDKHSVGGGVVGVSIDTVLSAQITHLGSSITTKSKGGLFFRKCELINMTQ